MRKFFGIFLNWRIDVIALLFAVGVALLVCDGDNLKLLVATKIAGIFMLYLCGLLTQHWGDKIKELEAFDINEDD